VQAGGAARDTCVGVTRTTEAFFGRYAVWDKWLTALVKQTKPRGSRSSSSNLILRVSRLMADGFLASVPLAQGPQHHLVGAVLTGGRSTRMGRDKALIEVDGSAMVDRVGGALFEAGSSIVVAVGPPALAGGLASVDDLYPGEGPLGGVITALKFFAARARSVCVVACDLPWLDAAALGELVRTASAAEETNGFDVVMARTDRLEPLCALWNPQCVSALQAEFDSGQRAVRDALDELLVATVVVPTAALRNVNTPDDLLSR
jgi:molybdopterin-guanine dinucleotide biosynthesis protein A